jgi:peroxiredoxin Q/BCP
MKPVQLLLAALLFVCATSSHAELAVGDVAPDFRLLGSDGQYYSLEQFKDKQYVIIAFFPKAFTGG